MKRILFIDRDGTIIVEPPVDYQIDKLEKFAFVDGAILSLQKIRKYTNFEFVMASNQDGLGTESFPEDTFWPYQNLMVQTLKSVGVEFDDVLIDPSFEHENSPMRKPGTGMMQKYISDPEYDMSQSLVIGDRYTDVLLAKNLGCKAVYLGTAELAEDLNQYCLIKTTSWTEAERAIISYNNQISVVRNTAETKISLSLYPGNPEIKKVDTGVKFFDHMLMQIPVHGCFGMDLCCKGDIEVDEHHTIEDVAIALGTAVNQLWRERKLINRYAFTLPMDDCLAQVAIDLGGRPWLIMDAEWKREKIGDFPTEMIFHFFKSFADNAKCNLNIKAEGDNEHHKLEGIFKALAKCLKHAISYDFTLQTIPSSKGML
ncbi:MAG: bifunctional histidinol-phosphatase/imidazoleglycerol-phosphate dehydratase HisB [Bacteroidales bacterium]|nr:bifunctional histidinol-phosphatase/imidazoleglycerol-phosphate dehydratase HisB [Bacteroidales bacterium]